MIVKSGEKISVMHDFYDLYENPVQRLCKWSSSGGAKYYKIMKSSVF